MQQIFDKKEGRADDVQNEKKTQPQKKNAAMKILPGSYIITISFRY